VVKRRTGTGLRRFDRRICGEAEVLAGVDEAGRGPLAGPVVASAVVLKPGARIPELDDCKNLTPDQRERLFHTIMLTARAVSWASVGERLIDSTNILRASIMAMTWAVESLDVEPELLLVDGPFRLPVGIEQKALVGGDGSSLSVAAASVIAKVTRDRMMLELDRVYPQYLFKHNKGYPTKAHLEALSRHGPCPAHRMSFAPVKLQAQLSLVRGL
jgi:ribonuclease HII